MSSEKPILFSGRLVNAILQGRKTQTRRVMKPQPTLHHGEWEWISTKVQSAVTLKESVHLGPYGKPGDRLWVRETWRAEEQQKSLIDGIRFRADGGFSPIENTREAAQRWMDAYDNGRHGENWRPSIFMPRWASRLSLDITGIRVERLQDISEADAVVEGVRRRTNGGRRGRCPLVWTGWPCVRHRPWCV